MASSGSFNTNAYEIRYLTFAWSIKSQSVANNSTVINWSLKGAGGTSTTKWYESGNFKVVINGTTVYQSATRIKLKLGTVVASGTATIKHNNNGTKTFSASAEAGIYNYAVNCRGSGTWTLTPIPRYATVTQTMTSKTETTAVMKWTSDKTIDYIWYSINNGSSWTGINVADGTSGTYTISGLAANTKYNVKTRVRSKESQLTTDSTVLAVTTYAYPYANSMPNFTIGNKLTLGLYNPLKRSVTVNMLGADNSQISNDTTAGTSITGYAGEVVVERLYTSIPNALSGTYKVKVTYGSHVTTKTGGTYTVNTSVCAPTIGNVTYKDTNTSVVNITGNNQLIVRNQSKVQYNVTGLAARCSATIRSCKVSVNGNAYNLTLSGSTATGGNASIDSGTQVTAYVIVTDSRNISYTKQVPIPMIDWHIPSAIINLQRQSNFYSETDITVDADYAYVDGKNAVTITYRAKKHGTSAYTVSGTLQDNILSTFTIDNNFAWDVQVTVKDSFGGTVTYNLSVARGMPIIYFDRENNSVGVNCFPKDEYSLEVNGVNLGKNVMTRSLSAAITNLIEGNYTIVPLDLSNSVGDKLTVTSDGGIKIGANVSKVMISGSISYDSVGTTDKRHMRICKNSYSANNTLAWSWETMVQSQPCNTQILPILANVTEDDVIYLMYHTNNSGDKIGGNTYGCRTSLTVEVIA